MSTTLYFRSTIPDWSRGEGDADLRGTTRTWSTRSLTVNRGPSLSSGAVTSVAGPTPGIEPLLTGQFGEWVSDPLDRDVTISGTVSINLWGLESSMNANATIWGVIERLASTGAVASTITTVGSSSELGTAAAVRSASSTPTSTNMLKGDRLRVRVFFDDVGGGTNMAATYTLTFNYEGPTAAADGDSYVTFTEDFGFLPAIITQGISNDSLQMFGASGSQEKLAQGFTLASDTNVLSAALYMFKEGAPSDNLVLDIVSTLDGSSLGSATVAASTLSTTVEAWITFTFGSPVALTAGSYFLQLSRSGARDTVNFGRWRYQSATNPYTGGTLRYRDTGSWNEFATSDYMFIVNQATAGSTLYLTDTAAAVDPNGASFDAFEAWTSRGDGSAGFKTTNPATGPTAPLQATNGSAANAMEWFTKQLTAFTLDGLIACNIRAQEGNAVLNAAIRVEIAVCASDGTSPVVWGAANDGVELGTSEAAMTFYIAGDSMAVTDGQRLRIRVFFDDAPGLAMGIGFGLTLWFDGATPGASKDTYITLPQTVTEYSAGGAASLIYQSGMDTALLVQ